MVNYKLKKFNQIFHFRDFNRFLFFSNNLQVLSILNFNLKAYLFTKKLKISLQNTYVQSLYSGFSYLNFNFLKGSSFEILISSSYLGLKVYKSKLKTIIKNSYNIPFPVLIRCLNVEIDSWYMDCGYFASSSYLIFLDFYLYRLLWKFCRRLHPRRPSSWIFEKYWKNYSGKFRFSAFDPLKGSYYFLNSHFDVYKPLKKLSITISPYDFRDRKKSSCDFFKKVRSQFHSVYGVLFDIQRGLCPFCNNFFSYFNIKDVGIYQLSSFTKIKNTSRSCFGLILVHRSCLIF